ncbi:MAG: hypothetical protein J7M12_04630 [Candidatus Hydrogenedentes bacterium]|nr:hypothetical protein [Candidatus Hydrogenedentota bacterium]
MNKTLSVVAALAVAGSVAAAVCEAAPVQKGRGAGPGAGFSKGPNSQTECVNQGPGDQDCAVGNRANRDRDGRFGPPAVNRGRTRRENKGIVGPRLGRGPQQEHNGIGGPRAGRGPQQGVKSCDRDDCRGGTMRQDHRGMGGRGGIQGYGARDGRGGRGR